MFKLTTWIIWTNIFLASQSVASDDHREASGGHVGTGGDWRRIMLDQAQREAANWANSASLNQELFSHIPGFNPEDTKYKLVLTPGILQKLAGDIISSDHLYRDDAEAPHREYNTCAWTNDPARANMTDIVFSLNLCETGLKNGGQTFADRLLIHETVHHLLLDSQLRVAVGAVFQGTTEQQDRDEDQLCDAVSVVIQQVFEMVVLNGRSHWRDIENPYFTTSEHVDYTFELRGFHVTAWTGATGNAETKDRMIVWGGCREGAQTIYACGDDKYFNDGAMYSPQDNTWAQMTTQNAPSPRAEAGSAWTAKNASASFKDKLVVWGGCVRGDGCQEKLNDGGIYDPSSNAWTKIAASTASPAPRVHHALVWTGSKIIVWGGHTNNAVGPTLTPPLADGGVYDVATGLWQTIPVNTESGPSARGYSTAIWTGNTGNPDADSKMLLWGGCVQEITDACDGLFGDGYLFDPITMQWSQLHATGNAPVGRHNYSAVYQSEQARLYIFGGFDADKNVIADGHYLDLKTMHWFSMANMAEGRFKHAAVWAGDKMLIFGGKIYNQSARSYELASSVVSFTPGAPGSNETGRWSTLKTEEMVPLKAIEHSAVWTGFSLLVWGGQIFDRGFTNTGSQFFPGISAP
jgi:hypothetical protein